MKDKKGFTLVELLLVVAILAFLISIVVIAAANISEDAKKKSMYGSLVSLKTAVQSYYLLYGIFPTGTGHPGGVQSLRNFLIETAPQNQRLFDNIPEDIFSSATGDSKLIHYELNGNNRTYAAWSAGVDDATTLTVGNDTLGAKGDDIFITNARNEVWQGQ